MKKKVFSLMMMLLLAVTGFVRADELTVHDGTATNGFVPVYGYYADAYLKCEMVYPASELSAMNGAQISSLKFYATQTDVSWGVANFQVFVTEVASEQISDFAGPGTMVYEGVLSIAGGEMLVNFTTPYAYNGGNLLIGIYNTVTGTYVTSTWQGESVSGASVQGYSYSSLGAISATQRNFLPKTTFTYTGGGGGAGETVLVEIGDGGTATSNYLPSYNYFKYTLSQQLYTAAEIGTAGMITSIAFYNGGAEKTRTYDLYMVNTTKSSFAGSTDWITVTAADKVFTGQVTMVAGAWTTITLDVPFVYDGTSNLAVIVDDNSGSYTTSPHMACNVFDASAMALRVYSDGTNYDPMAPTSYSGTVMNVKNQIQLTINTNGGGGTGGVDQLHVKFMDGDDVVVDRLDLGVRPAGAWMEPFDFTMYTDGYTYTVNILDFTPTDGLFSVSGEDLPFHVIRDQDVDLMMTTNGTQEGVIERQFVAITAGDRAAHIWPVRVELYAPEIPDVWEKAYNLGTVGDGFSYAGIPSQITPTMLHNDYTLPFPEIPEGVDAVYKFKVESDMIINAYVDENAQNGKVALYREDFNGEGGPMADNNYTGLQGTGGGSGGGTPFEAMIGDETSTTGSTYFPFHTLWNYSLAENLFLASELAEAGVTSAPMTSLSWFVNSMSCSTPQNNISIYMGNVGDEALTTTSHTTAGMTLVYTGNNVLPTVGQWNEFVFNEGTFSWDGVSNVLILCVRNNGSYQGTITWKTHNPGFTAMSYAYSDTNGGYDVTTPNSMSGSSSTNRASIIMKSTGRTDTTDPNANTTPGALAAEVSAGPVISNLGLRPGTYYLVASATQPDYTVYINVDEMPCPAIDAEGFAFNPTPADNDDEIEPASVTLRWMIPEYATGWRLVFGSTYYPEQNHPQTVIYPEDGGFTSNMANSFTVRNLWNNTNYFWHVEFNNSGCPDGVMSPIWGFTTHLNIPTNLTADDYTVFEDETITLHWNAVVDRTYRQYFIYRDGVKVGETQMNNIGNTSFVDGPLAYNMAGYTYYVTAIYDEGESAPSDPVTVKVSGRGTVEGHVYEQDGTTGIANATVSMVGQDEFGVSHTYTFTTNSQGYYTGQVYAGSYNGSASCNGYQPIEAPVQGNPIAIAYNNTTSPVDYMLDENFYSPCSVIAQYYPDSTDVNAPYVKVFWGCGLPGEDIIEDFETGDFSQFDWQLDGAYPWSITTNNPYEGTYCMKSGGAGVANVVSNMTVTVNIPADGIMSFFGKISSENNWDYGYFFIDGVQKGQYTGAGSWGEKRFDITAGDHIFQWRYTKDGSVNSNDDCFYVDYINFYKRPEPAQPGWHTYCESEFNNAVGSNLTTTPSWAYEYPAAFLNNNYAGWNITKVSLFSDNMYSAVGGNYTCRIYVGGSEPAAGTLVSTLTVDVPSNQNAWVDWDLTTPVNVTGNEPIWVVWTANTTVSSWPAGCCDGLNDYGTWWDGGNGWEHLDYGTWTMRHWFTNRAGLSEVVNAPIVDNNPLSSKLRYFAKGEENHDAVCVNPNAVKGAALESGVNRAFSHYRVYRTNCYNEGEYTLDNTVVLACELHDTLYIDVSWPDAAPGVYKWGVGCVYNGNRGEEIESEINWSEPIAIAPEMANRDQVFDFEDGQIPSGWTNDATYPWTVVNNAYAGYNGTYCIKSGNGGIANSTSSISTTVNYSDAGTVSFLGGFWGEGSSDSYDWDKCRFYIDGSIMIDYGAHQMWENVSFPVAAGNHTFTWTYKKDGSVNPTGDAFFVDDVTFSTSGSGGGGNNGGGYGPGTDPVQEPRESVIVWSNCLDKDMYLDNVTVNVLLNSADSPEGTTVDFINRNPVEQENYPVAQLVLDESGFYAFDTFRRGEYFIQVRHEGYQPIDDTVLIWDNTDLRYVMTEILYGVGNVYVSRTGWAMWDEPNIPGGGGGGGGQGGNASTFSVNFDDGQMPAGWTTIDANNDGYNWVLGSQVGGIYLVSGASLAGSGHNSSADLICSGSYSNYTGQAITPDNYLVSPQVTLAAGSTFSFWACAQDASYAAEHFGVFISDNGTSDWTSVQEWTMTAKSGGDVMSIGRDGQTRAQGNWHQYTVDLSSYAGQKYIAIRHFNCNDQFILDVDDIELTSGAKSDERHLEYYKVMCTSIDGVPIFNHNTVNPFCQLSTNEPYNAPLVEGEHYLCKVACMYSTGLGPWSEPVEWEYEPCDHWGPVDEVTVNTTGQGNHIEWVFEHGYNPYGGDTPGPGPGGSGDSFSVNFDDGQIPAGWTTIDANNDGYDWVLGSQVGGVYLVSGASLAGTGHNSSADLICSGSYSNYTGQAITPDNYLVSPQVTLGAGSTFSFWACAQDASYAAEHFGVFISSNGTSDWTSVQEWTMTAKSGGNVMSIGRGGQTRAQGNWHQYTVDLSAYAGQKYIAIRHFNCNDQFILDVDDIELTSGAKEGQRFVNDDVIYRQYSEDGVLLNFHAIKDIYFRSYLLYTLSNNSNFTMMDEYQYGQFIINPAYPMDNFMEEFENFYVSAETDFSMLGKLEVTNLMSVWKSSVEAADYLSIMMDVNTATLRADNDHCLSSMPFCTSEVIEFEAAYQGGATGEPGPEYGCLSSQPYPSWYHMRIHTAGKFVIHMEAHDATGQGHDIDYCIWGPFSDPYEPCVDDLTCDKMVDCSYSTASVEDVFLGYPISQHNHGSSSLVDGNCVVANNNPPHVPEVGEYYILMITNYSQQQQTISFTKTEGEGETDCEIVAPSNVIGFLITEDGEYVAFAGPEDREYTVEGEFGDHEYCVRPIYPGEMVLPDHNYGWSMGCPVCSTPNGSITCDAYMPIHGEAINATDQVKIWWGEENPGPGPEPGVPFFDDFEAGNLNNWTLLDADNDGDTWQIGTPAEYGIGNAHSGTYCATSWSWNNYSMDPDNWMISPEVVGATSVTYYVATNTGYPDHYAIMASSTGTNTSDFSLVFEEDVPIGKGTASNVRSSIAGGGHREMSPWTARTVQLPAGTKYVAFRHYNSYDMNYLFVDDVTVNTGAKSRASIEGFKVYRSTDNINYTYLSTVNYVDGQTYYEYIDTPSGAGTYYYQVTTVYDNECESDPAVDAENPTNDYVVVGVTGIDENSGKVALYPNPTKGNVTIEANGMSRITVVSMLGQVVFDTEINANVYTLNMAQFNAGMYMVRVYTEEGLTVKRVTVMQ
jgi:hypothetical protein